MLEIIKRHIGEHIEAKLLIVGDGNFSFSLELANQIDNTIYATSLDLPEKLYENPLTKENLDRLKKCNHVVIKHGVDATNLEKVFPNLSFTVILFNFPHVGGKSNIRKCRLLLENFFSSASSKLDTNGSIVVTLCKGQSGLPCDVSRGAYGNTWQISTQASKADLILVELTSFQRSNLSSYEEAGYRGSINKKFLSRGGHIHVFKQGKPLPSSSYPELNEARKSSTSREESIIGELNEIINSKSIYEQLDAVIENVMQKFFTEHNVAIKKIEPSYLSEFTSIDINVDRNEIIMIPSCKNFHTVGTLQGPNVENFKISYLVKNRNFKLLPYVTSLSQKITYKLSKTIIDFTDVCSWLLEGVFNEFILQRTECNCPTPTDENCDCLNPAFYPYINLESGDDYDISSVPYFVEDVPEKYLNYRPRVTLYNKKNENDENSFNEIDVARYKLKEMEKVYFGKDKLKEIVSCCKSVKFTINGLNVASVSICEKYNYIRLTFNCDEIIFACYGVKDLRYLSSNDQLYKMDLSVRLNEDIKQGKIRSLPHQYQTLIQYPLCFRHDICFWLKDGNTEDQFIQSIHSITKNLVHSVRLIKVLRYDSNEVVSYCYRVLYNRLDGPLNHLHTVHLQNIIRKHLLSIGFDLR